MKKINIIGTLTNVMKGSLKSKIIVTVVGVVIAGATVAGGIIIYNNRQENLNLEVSNDIELNQSEKEQRFKALRESYNQKIKLIESFILTDSLDNVKIKLNEFDKTIKDKNLNKAEDLNTKLNIDFENLVKENEEFVRKAYLELKDSDLANYTNQIKDEFYEQIGSLEALIEKGNYLMASKKVTEIKALLDINKEELLKPQLSDNDGTSSIGEISGGESSGGTSPDGVSSGGGNAQTPSQSLPNVPSTPSGAVAPSGYSGGLMINWDLTHAINESNANGYRQGINREYFQRYLNGENIEVLLSERKQYPYDEIVNGENKRGLAVDMKVTYTSCNSNDISTLINSQSSIGLSLKEHPLRNKQYDYIESFVVYDGNTNIIYKLGVATGFADPVE
ncbi:MULTISPECIES: hypothetical protein [Clostridium]|jgi:uncharacterized membrane protein YgcG|uniref:hypothetical protein n=1 Tax=Clostridium TaxID=1485 RepID=UPI001D5EC123|nr:MULTISPECIES: hypothetical protein [Clostridium]MBS5308662.1 hypothetical protein [Clostridium sp.]MDB1933147.1 hypothetical protein [Clostridium tertium]MDB1938165.1 hypothetical protein [Clostridium tertium]MDB1944096.1 hypothetical protein [Clostridium tertium]MDB1950740.1 hypothetical protein [Clostridium tertium]